MNRIVHLATQLTAFPHWWLLLLAALLLMALVAGAPDGVPCASAPSC